MAGMYPTNKEISSFGKTVKFPGVDENGKFTNGDFSNPDIPPSFLDADTINLVIDNLNALVAHLGGNANNTDGEQLKKLFSITAEANKAIKRDSQGRAKVAAPVEADDIARKAEVDLEKQARTQAVSSLSQAFQQSIDAEAKARTQSMSTLEQSFQQAINNEAQARAKGDKSIVDYGDPSGNRKVQVGFAGPSVKAGELVSLAGYTQAGAITKLKDASNEAVRKLLGLDAVVPVVGFGVYENAGYIQLGNGLIVQWGATRSPIEGFTTTTTFPISFTTTKYAIVATKEAVVTTVNSTDEIRFFDKQRDRVSWSVRKMNEFSWIAIGV